MRLAVGVGGHEGDVAPKRKEELEKHEGADRAAVVVGLVGRWGEGERVREPRVMAMRHDEGADGQTDNVLTSGTIRSTNSTRRVERRVAATHACSWSQMDLWGKWHDRTPCHLCMKRSRLRRTAGGGW